jgi:hypothetical protein
MRKLHGFLIAVTSIGIVGGVCSKASLQPLPPSSLPELPASGQKPLLPREGVALPNPEDLLDLAANLVIQKYQNTSCEELSQMKPQSGKSSQAGGKAQEVLQEKAIELLRQNPEIREEFINRVAPPIANKMFDCKVIP